MLFSLTWPPYVCKGVLLLVYKHPAHTRGIRSSIKVSQSDSRIISHLHSICICQSISTWVKIFFQSLYISLYSLSTHYIHSIFVTKVYERMAIIIHTKVMLDEHFANLFCSISFTCDISGDEHFNGLFSLLAFNEGPYSDLESLKQLL